MQKRITSKDVAKEAGVSRTTVSYILNNTEGVRISEETKVRVLEAAKKLGYHLDINAQALKTNRSMSIGVVSRRNINESRFANVLAGIKDVLFKEKYNILLCSDKVDENGFPEYYRLYKSKKIDGIIFISYQEQLAEEQAEVRAEMMLKEKIPCVFVDYHLKDPMVSCVNINYFHGAYISVKHLVEKGHKNIAFLMSSFDNEQERQRLLGVKKAIEEAKDVKLLTYNFGIGKNSFIDNIEKMLNERNNYSALIVAWGNVAAQTIYYCNKLSIKVPQDLSVISLGVDSSARFTYPVLSGCELPLNELGVKSAEIIMESINNGGTTGINFMLPCALNLREST